ncbi:MAG: signal peptidase I, partial [Candidatus Tectimicrobiota bacterium]
MSTGDVPGIPHDPQTPKPPRPKGLQKGSWLRSNLEALGMAVALAIVLRIFVVQAFTIPSGSMVPTLQVGDYILVNKFIYHFTPVARGDIVVFRSPEDPDRDYIKRVIGLAGEEIAVKEGIVFVNSRPLDETYAANQAPGSWGAWSPAHEPWGPKVVPPGHYFLLGDNRNNSRDSRVWGFLDG